MNTWLVSNGDLVLEGGSFATLSGPAKIQQDLGIASLTPLGSDRFHPRWGSVLEQYIGQAAGPMTKSLLQAEVARLITNYQKVQLNKMNQAITAGFATVYSLNDLVQSIQSITVTQNFDSFSITVELLTMAGTAVSVSSSVNANGNSSATGTP